MKTCNTCKTPKPYDQFHKCKKSKLGIKGDCKKCRSDYVKFYRSNNRDLMKENSNRYYYNNKDKVRDGYYKRYYGISMAQYLELLEKQNNSCALCGCVPKKHLSVDHDHKTGKVRGLLCLKCNSSLGVFGDNIEGFLKVIDYLKRGSLE